LLYRAASTDALFSVLAWLEKTGVYAFSSPESRSFNRTSEFIVTISPDAACGLDDFDPVQLLLERVQVLAIRRVRSAPAFD
jgi:hypothetical protein